MEEMAAYSFSMEHSLVSKVVNGLVFADDRFWKREDRGFMGSCNSVV